MKLAKHGFSNITSMCRNDIANKKMESIFLLFNRTNFDPNKTFQPWVTNMIQKN